LPQLVVADENHTDGFGAVSAFEFTGKRVVGVADGDTITVLYEGKK